MKDCSIFVCCHKPSIVPKNDCLVPIHVGRTTSAIHLNMLGDDTGDNISSKNKYYCELTATYWIWKNVKADIVGLCHYRRYFNFKDTNTKINKVTPNFCDRFGLTKKNVINVLNGYDLILPKRQKIKRRPITLYDFYKKECIQEDMDMILKIIKQKYPQQYRKAYRTLHTSITGYYWNMIIAKKKIFDDYAKWLFSILFELENKIQKDVLNRDSYQQRVYGFLAERLMTVYIDLHPELKVKEVPMLFIEDNKKKWYKYCFKRFKNKLLSILGVRRKK